MIATRWLAFVLVLWAGTAAAQDAVGVEILQYGIFRADIVGKQRAFGGTQHNVVDNICHLATTGEVPLRIGLHFGMRYRVTGPVRGERVLLKKVMRYPAIMTPPAPDRPASQVASFVELLVGAVSYTEYALEQPWELVPGIWTFQFFDRDRKLAERGFTVTEGAAVSEAADPACFQLSS